MYSNKENVNILTSLLLEYGVSDAVVCPGSRNAPIVHTLACVRQYAADPLPTNVRRLSTLSDWL